MAIVKHFYLAIDECHTPNNGQANGGGENHLVNHPSYFYLFLIYDKKPVSAAHVPSPNGVKTGHLN